LSKGFTGKNHLNCRKTLKSDILFSNSNSDNHGQKSWDIFALVALFQMRQTNSHALIQLHLLSPSPYPIYNVGHFNIVWGGGGAEKNFEKDNSAFSNSVFKTQIIHAMMQVSQGILSTIVVLGNLS